MCFFLGLACKGNWLFLELDYFLSYDGEVFNYNFFKTFLSAFLFFFFFWDPYNLNFGAFNIVPKVFEAVLNYFHSFPCILLFSSYFHQSICLLIRYFFYVVGDCINCVECLLHFLHSIFKSLEHCYYQYSEFSFSETTYFLVVYLV